MVARDAAVHRRPRDRVRRIREALPAGIFLVGNAFDGVGVSDLARAAEETSARAHAGLPEAGMTDTIYALTPVFAAASPELRAELFEDDALRNAADEIEALVKEWAGRVDVRGSYSTVGFRADADLILWLTAGSPRTSSGSSSSSGGRAPATSSIRSRP